MNIGMRWGALLERCTPDHDNFDTEHAETCVDISCCYPPPLQIAGLALFAGLMGFVECAMHCPLMYHAEGKRTYDAANKKTAFPAWESLSEASREQWMHCLTTAAFKGSIEEVLR